MNQFIIEAIFITFLGGLGGIVLGFIITYLIYLIANYINFDLNYRLYQLSLLKF